MRERGFTFYELMVVTVVMGMLAASTAGLAAALHRSERTAAAYVDDVTGLRRAVRALEDDLRAASSVAGLPYELADGTLRRDGEVLARNIAVFEVAQEGRLARVRLGLGPRRGGASARRAVVELAVRLQEEAR